MAPRRPVQRPVTIGVLCSGKGTNLQAILDAAAGGRMPARVGVVISDRSDAYALTRAAKAGVPACWIDPKSFSTREAFEQAMVQTLRARGVRLVCLAGFMRILSPAFVRAFPNRILNIHPALLPAFPGAHGIRDALAWGVKVTGVTIHLVDEDVDHGPILLQEAVPVRPGDTPAAVLTRMHRVEHRLYPEAIRLMAEGRVRVQGRRALIRSARAVGAT
jgi:phosphoribosylglycinamide formyltransferase-1